MARSISDFLHAQGWYVMRIPSGLYQRPQGKARIRVAEPGAADLLALKAAMPTTGWSPWMFGFFVETKRPGGKLSTTQSVWHASMRGRGFEVLTVNSYDDFVVWFKARYGTS